MKQPSVTGILETALYVKDPRSERRRFYREPSSASTCSSNRSGLSPCRLPQRSVLASLQGGRPRTHSRRRAASSPATAMRESRTSRFDRGKRLRRVEAVARSGRGSDRERGDVGRRRAKPLLPRPRWQSRRVDYAGLLAALISGRERTHRSSSGSRVCHAHGFAWACVGPSLQSDSSNATLRRMPTQSRGHGTQNCYRLSPLHRERTRSGPTRCNFFHAAPSAASIDRAVFATFTTAPSSASPAAVRLARSPSRVRRAH